MRLEKYSSQKIITKASMSRVWIFGGVTILGIIYLLTVLWLNAEFVVSQEILGVSFLLLLLLYYPLSRFRLPTIEATFDVQKGNFILEKKWFWMNQIVNYSILEIKDIHTVQKGRFGKAKLYFRIEVELISGAMVPLSTGNYRPEQNVKMRALELEEFLREATLSRNPEINR